jgi:hypothetical protein
LTKSEALALHAGATLVSPTTGSRFTLVDIAEQTTHSVWLGCTDSRGNYRKINHRCLRVLATAPWPTHNIPEVVP